MGNFVTVQRKKKKEKCFSQLSFKEEESLPETPGQSSTDGLLARIALYAQAHLSSRRGKPPPDLLNPMKVHSQKRMGIASK